MLYNLADQKLTKWPLPLVWAWDSFAWLSLVLDFFYGEGTSINNRHSLMLKVCFPQKTFSWWPLIAMFLVSAYMHFFFVLAPLKIFSSFEYLKEFCFWFSLFCFSHVIFISYWISPCKMKLMSYFRNQTKLITNKKNYRD